MTDSLGLDFTLSEAIKTVSTDTFINVIRRREEILYKKSANNRNVNIAYFSSSPLTTQNSLFIADRSSSLLANRVENDSESVVLDNVSSYTIETDKFLLTDVFTDEDSTIGKVPLYLQHIIDIGKVPRQSTTNLNLQGNVKLISVEILDSNFSPIQVPEISIDLARGVVYNNLESSYNPDTGEYTVYHVRYTVKINNAIFDYTDLLSNIDIYRIATLDDLDISLNIINDGRKVYLIEEVDNNFNVTLPTANDYAFKITSFAKLKLVPPPPLDIDSPWRIGVTNTQFYTTVLSQVLKYRIAEFNTQAWNPVQPYKKSISEDSEILATNLIKTNFGKVYQSPVDQLFIDLLINDSQGNGVAAFTTNPTKNNNVAENDTRYVVWSNINRIGIKSVDGRGGFIEIEGLKLKSTYKTETTYYYEEDQYTFSLIDFNPINNQNILSQKVSLFVDPDTISTNKTQTLYYLISDKAGKVIDSNWPDYNPDAQKLDDGRTLYYEKIPDFVTDPASGLVTFISQYTTEGSGVLLVLGDVQVTELESPDNGTSLDARIRGGGVIESIVDDAKARNLETNWYWDLGYWDGTPYPGNASYLVEIPVDVMEGAGGIFLSSQAKDIIGRHKASGVYPIVKAYGIDPTVSGVTVSGESITIKWGSYGY